MYLQVLAALVAEHVRKVRRTIQDYSIKPKDIWCVDEIRVYASAHDLNTMTLELSSVRDPLVRKVANPREGFTGIAMASGDGETLAFVLVTTKALPSGYETEVMILEQRNWDKKQKKVIVALVTITFAVIHGIVVLKVPPGHHNGGFLSSIHVQVQLSIHPPS